MDKEGTSEADPVSSPAIPEAGLLQLPAELKEWAQSQASLLHAIEDRIISRKSALTEAALWDVIAETAEPQWPETRRALRAAEDRLRELAHPDNAPLGLIGGALESDETNDAEMQHAMALADFTIINEGLRQREDLHRLLGAMVMNLRTINRALGTSLQAQRVTEEFGQVALLTPEEERAQQESTAVTKPTRLQKGLFRSFDLFASRNRQEAPQTAQLGPAVRTKPAPSSQGT